MGKYDSMHSYFKQGDIVMSYRIPYCAVRLKIYISFGTLEEDEKREAGYLGKFSSFYADLYNIGSG